MLYHCQICGEPFEAAPAAKRKFCSRACMGKAKTKKVKRICQSCGKPFLAKRYKVQEGKAKFCSRECADTGWDEPCANCGKMVHRTPFHAQRFDNAFCSRECYSKFKSDQVECTCVQCGKSYTNKRSRAERFEQNFCSQQCYFDSRVQEFVTLICKQCNQQFERPKFFINDNMYQGMFCSIECSAKSRRLPDSVRSEYNHEFTENLKHEIRKRDDYRCQECGADGPDEGVLLHVHHIDYDKTNNHPSNLITLCHSCHSKTNYNREYWTKHFQISGQNLDI